MRLWSVTRFGLSQSALVVCESEEQALRLGRRALGLRFGAAGDDGKAQSWWLPEFPHYADELAGWDSEL